MTFFVLIFAFIFIVCIFLIAWVLQHRVPIHTLVPPTPTPPEHHHFDLSPGQKSRREWYWDNTFIQILHQNHLVVNTTDCWVCGLLPHSAHRVTPFLPYPFSIRASCIIWLALAQEAFNRDTTDGGVNDLWMQQFRSELFYKRSGDKNIAKCSTTDMTTTEQDEVKEFLFAHLRAAPLPAIPAPIIPIFLQKGLVCIRGLGPIQLGVSSCSIITVTLNTTNSPLFVASKNSYFVCGTNAYGWCRPNWGGVCYLSFLLPPVYTAPSSYHKQKDTRHVRTSIKRVKRYIDTSEIVQTETTLQQFVDFNLGFFYFIGPVVNSKRIRRLTRVVEAVINQTVGALDNLTAEVQATRVVALQNRMVLDVILADRGGACRVIRSSCCVYIPDNAPNVYQALSKLQRIAAEIHQETGTWTWSGWLWDIFVSWGWKLLMVAACIGGIVLGCCICIQCLPLICSMSTSASTSCIPKNVNIHDTNRQMMLQKEVDDLMNIEVEDLYDDAEKLTRELGNVPCSPPPLSIDSSNSNNYTYTLAPAESYYMTPSNIPAPPSSRRPLRHL